MSGITLFHPSVEYKLFYLDKPDSRKNSSTRRRQGEGDGW